MGRISKSHGSGTDRSLFAGTIAVDDYGREDSLLCEEMQRGMNDPMRRGIACMHGPCGLVFRVVLRPKAHQNRKGCLREPPDP